LIRHSANCAARRFQFGLGEPLQGAQKGVVAFVGLRDRNRDLLALPTGQPALARAAPKPRYTVSAAGELANLCNETQLALKTIKKLLILPVASLGWLRVGGFRRVQFRAQKSEMNAGYISGYEDVVQL
jgi:hypothetical protein